MVFHEFTLTWPSGIMCVATNAKNNDLYSLSPVQIIEGLPVFAEELEKYFA